MLPRLSILVVIVGVLGGCRAGEDSVSILGDLSSMYKIYQECSSSDVSACLKVKLASSLGRAARAADLSLFPGVSLVKEPSAQAENNVESDAELNEASLPRSLNDKEAALDNIIVDRATSFINTHSLQFKLSEFEFPGFGVQEEGRGKRRRTLGALLLMFMMVAGTVLPIKLGTLALLAGKALIISKLALALAAIIGLKKLFSSHDGHETSYQVVSVPHHGHRRNLEAQDMAYRGYAPQPSA